jgi:ribosomal protein S4
LTWIDVRVGPETIVDPTFIVTRSMEDFVTWVDTSKIHRKVLKYNDKVSIYMYMYLQIVLAQMILCLAFFFQLDDYDLL